jgi:hypothetical protein
MQHHSAPHAEVWHTLAALAGDDELLALFHEIKPAPKSASEMLMWRPRPATSPKPTAPMPLSIYPTSGLAFLQRGRQLVTTRAGEYWNHQHRDAGTFILHQDDTIWIDDAGTCEYSRSEYVDYYLKPEAHNVAFAPDFVPPTRRTQYEGTPTPARYLSQLTGEHVTAVCAETGILSGDALSRSTRWFLQLDDEALIVWDDLAAHSEQRFKMLLHTRREVQRTADTQFTLRHGEQLCPLAIFCDAAATVGLEPAKMGQVAPKPDGSLDADGTVVSMSTAPTLRVKFGAALGTGVRLAKWSLLDSAGGWLCELETAGASWQVWFNPLADGRRMHQNCISTWQGYETDAYALLIRTHNGRRQLMAIEGSLVRQSGRVLTASLTRQPLVTIDL